MGYTDYKGKGNQYIGGRKSYSSGVGPYYYFWLLVNVSADGAQMNIIKGGYEDIEDTPLPTGNEAAGNVSVNNYLNPASFQVFPQPANNQISVIGIENFEAFKIININGETVKEQANIVIQKIDVADLPKGIYLLQLMNKDNFIITKKIIIEN